MSQQLLRKNQVVDYHLTGLMQSERVPGSFIADEILGIVNTPYLYGKYIEWGKEAYRVWNSTRALGERAKRVNFDFTTKPYAMGVGDTLENAIDDREDRATKGVGNLNLAKQKASMLKMNMMLAKEKRMADFITNASNYANTKTAGAVWSTVSTKIHEDIIDAHEFIRQDTGMRGNTLILSPTILNDIKKNTALLEYFKYTEPGMVPLASIKEMFGVEKILIGDAAYLNDAGSMVDMYGTRFAALIYQGKVHGTGPIDPQDLPPSFAWTLQEAGLPRVRRYRDESAGSEVIAYDENTQILSTSTVAGCIFASI